MRLIDADKTDVHEILLNFDYIEWNCQEKRTPKLLVKAVKLAPSVAIEMTGMGRGMQPAG